MYDGPRHKPSGFVTPKPILLVAGTVRLTSTTRVSFEASAETNQKVWLNRVMRGVAMPNSGEEELDSTYQSLVSWESIIQSVHFCAKF